MRSADLNHPKVVSLMTALDISRPHAVGILILLFQFARDYSPDGDIDRWGEAAIATACGWPGPPRALLNGLGAAGWLDGTAATFWRMSNWKERRLLFACDDANCDA